MAHYTNGRSNILEASASVFADADEVFGSLPQLKVRPARTSMQSTVCKYPFHVICL